MADVPRSCLKLGGYPATIEGGRQAILDGYGSVVAQKGGRVYYARSQEALELFFETASPVEVASRLRSESELYVTRLEVSVG